MKVRERASREGGGGCRRGGGLDMGGGGGGDLSGMRDQKYPSVNQTNQIATK